MNFKTYYLKESNKPICHTDSNGDKYWLLNGKYHREDGPAIIYSNGDKYWWLNGKLHRKDGPAVERVDGWKEWYLNGKQFSEQDYRRELIRRGIIKDPSLEDVMDAI